MTPRISPRWASQRVSLWKRECPSAPEECTACSDEHQSFFLRSTAAGWTRQCAWGPPELHVHTNKEFSQLEAFSGDPFELRPVHVRSYFNLLPYTRVTHTDLLWRCSGRRGWEPASPTRRCSSGQRTRTSKTHKNNLVSIYSAVIANVFSTHSIEQLPSVTLTPFSWH